MGNLEDGNNDFNSSEMLISQHYEQQQEFIGDPDYCVSNIQIVHINDYDGSDDELLSSIIIKSKADYSSPNNEAVQVNDYEPLGDSDHPSTNLQDMHANDYADSDDESLISVMEKMMVAYLDCTNKLDSQAVSNDSEVEEKECQPPTVELHIDFD